MLHMRVLFITTINHSAFIFFIYYRAILSMDSNDQLPIDMVEQLLKFTPTAEERVLLDEHSEDIDSLARADRFLYEISK